MRKLRERAVASFARRQLGQWFQVGRVRAQPQQCARDLESQCWFPRRFSLRPDTRSSWATGQSRETKGARFRADRRGRQKTQASWTPPVTREIRARAVTHETLWGRADASFARRRLVERLGVGRVRAQPSKPARDLQRYSWFPRRFSLRPDTRSSRAPGQSRETKGARFRADRQGRQKIQASWTPPVTRGAPG